MPIRLFAAAALMLLFCFLGFVGGDGRPLDRSVIEYFLVVRADHPGLTSGLILFTQLGGATALLLFAGIGAGWLLLRGERRSAAIMLVTIIGGRLAIEAIKLMVDRSRPGFDAHPVAVFSQSFPSAHAGNSLITFGALALFVAPERLRRPTLGLAIVLALSIGATRPMLGVHWPTDVLGGWAFGLALLILVAGFRPAGRNAA